MGEVKVLIVENEKIIADTIADALTDYGYQALEPAITYTEAVERIEKEKPNIGIFDIQLSGKKTGIDLAKYVSDNYKFPFIFLTSNLDAHTLQEAKLAGPSAFLFKPCNNDELYATIELTLHNYAQQSERNNDKPNQLIADSIFIKIKEGYTRIRYDDIIYLKSDNVYIDIKTVDQKNYIIRGTLTDYENKLNSIFLRVHRSYIVNLMYLEKINYANLEINNEVIPLGNKYKSKLHQIIKKG
jgi:DNA-binding LytR/AlgR family response regulator